jgi:hypothetical protein
MSITIHTASQAVEVTEQNIFTAQTMRVFDTKIARAYTDVEQSDRDAADSDMGVIYRQFATQGLATIAHQCPSFMQQAQEQEQKLLLNEIIGQNLQTAQQSVHNSPLDERIEHWNRFRFSFAAVHNLNTQRSIKKIEIKSTPYETMIANEYIELDEQQQSLVMVFLLVTALNLHRIDTADTAAFAQIFNDDLNPTSHTATVEDIAQPRWQLPALPAWLKWLHKE